MSVLGIDPNPTVKAGQCQGTVYVRVVSDFSGTATDIAVPHFWGLYDYLRKLNQTGGIHGCPIDIQVADNKYDPATTSSIVQNWRTSDPHWGDVSTLFIFGTGPTEAAGPQLMKEKKTVIPGSYAGAFGSPVPVNKVVAYPAVDSQFSETTLNTNLSSPGWPYVFFPATDYSTGIRIAIQAAWAIAPGRVGMAHDTADNCAYCTAPLPAGQSYVRSLPGMSLGRDLIIPQTSDASAATFAQITQSVDDYFQAEIAQVVADPNYKPVAWLWSGNSVTSSALLAAAVAAEQQAIAANTQIPEALRSSWTLRVIANNWGLNESSLPICGSACAGVLYGIFPVPRFGDLQNSALMADVVALHDEFGNDPSPAPPMTPRTPDQYEEVTYVQGYVAGLMWAKGMEAAIAAGHSNPSGEDLKSALEGFDAVDTGGLTSGPISFSSTDHRPQSSESIYVVNPNNSFTFVSKYSIDLVSDWLGY
jgi:branched-chain amino acid transport system substrate-binding protein